MAATGAGFSTGAGASVSNSAVPMCSMIDRSLRHCGHMVMCVAMIAAKGSGMLPAEQLIKHSAPG